MPGGVPQVVMICVFYIMHEGRDHAEVQGQHHR